MQPVTQAEGARADLYAVLETEFTKLKEWLDSRLQHQENLLECLSNTHNFPSGLESSSMAVKDGTCPHCKKPVKPSQLTPAWECTGYQILAEHLSKRPEDQLRSVTPCIESVYDDASNPSVENVPLPGSAMEDVADKSKLGVEPEQERQQMEPLSPTTISSVNLRNRSFIQEQDLQSKLMDVFDQMDLDRSGCIDRWEFEEAFHELGLPKIRAFDIFNDMDKTKNGVIDRVEWLHVVEEAARSSEEDLDLLVGFIERLAHRQKRTGRLYSRNRRRRLCCIVRHDSSLRMTWDFWMITLLFYIAIMLPFSLGFGQTKALDTTDFILDMFFCFDVLLNFRTTYLDREDSVIVDGRKIACKYLKSWFLLDFVSSVPFDLITAGLLPNLSPARLLKVGKILKVLRFFRIGQKKIFAGTEFMEAIEEYSTTKAHHTILRLTRLVAVAFVLAHWLACFGAAVDTSHLDTYLAGKVQVGDPTTSQRYIAAMYWAMTTLSTVGYGDITPNSDEERLYAMFAMVIGGAFYGYIVGSVTSIVSDMDLNYRAFFSRMDLIQSWLDRHHEIPKSLRRKVRKHFKLTLSAKSVMDDSSIVGELSPALRADLTFFIIHEKVRHNPIFIGMPNTALANIVEVLQKTRCNEHEYIVKDGDPGVAMYILVEGVARYDQGNLWSPPGARVPMVSFQQLIVGDSFGEEIIFDLEETYTYSILTLTACTFHLISEDGFKDQYRNMPELRDQMYGNFLKSRTTVHVELLPTPKVDRPDSPNSDSKESKKQLSALSRQPSGMMNHLQKTQKPYRLR